MLIKRVYEIDPLTCPHCGSPMKVVAFIEPPQDEVVEKILRLCARSVPVGGLWQASAPSAPPVPILSISALVEPGGWTTCGSQIPPFRNRPLSCC